MRAPNWVGDLVMATAAFARIRSMYMHAEVVCGLKRSLAPVLAGSKSFDRHHYLGRVRGPLSLWREARALRRERFDLAILFTHSLSNLLVVRLAGIPERIGFQHGGRGWLLTDGVRPEVQRLDRKHGPRRKPVPMPLHYFALLDRLGMPRVGTRPILRVTEAEVAGALEVRRRLLGGEGTPFYLVNPGASFGASKLWRPERFAAAARELSARVGMRGICLAGPGEEALATGIAAGSGGALAAAVAPIVPLDVLKPLVRDAALLLTTDTGPRHYAVAFDVPVVCLMGPTDPGFTAYDLDRTVVLRHQVPCGPCHLKTCPLDHACMEKITVEEVVAACLFLLGRTLTHHSRGSP